MEEHHDWRALSVPIYWSHTFALQFPAATATVAEAPMRARGAEGLHLQVGGLHS